MVPLLEGIKMYPRHIVRKTYIYLFSNRRVMIANRLFERSPGIVKEIIRRLTWKVRKHWGKHYIPLVVPKHYYEKLGSTHLYDMEFRTPSSVEKYLALKYGDDWKKPKKEWIYWRDDGARDHDFDIGEDI